VVVGLVGVIAGIVLVLYAARPGEGPRIEGQTVDEHPAEPDLFTGRFPGQGPTDS